MKPHLHSNSSAKRWGGKPEDYQDLHDFLDQSKAHHPDMRHRAIFHHSAGIFLLERFFGPTRINSAGNVYSVRDVGEQHVIEDLGFIPTPQDYLECMTLEPWMGNPKDKSKTRITLTEAFKFPQGGYVLNNQVEIKVPDKKPFLPFHEPVKPHVPKWEGPNGYVD